MLYSNCCLVPCHSSWCMEYKRQRPSPCTAGNLGYCLLSYHLSSDWGEQCSLPSCALQLHDYISPSDSSNLQTAQRISDTWHSCIGSSALAIVSSFFTTVPLLKTNEKAREFAKQAIKMLEFLYGNTMSPEHKVNHMYSKWCIADTFWQITRNGKNPFRVPSSSKRLQPIFMLFLACALSKP